MFYDFFIYCKWMVFFCFLVLSLVLVFDLISSIFFGFFDIVDYYRCRWFDF